MKKTASLLIALIMLPVAAQAAQVAVPFKDVEAYTGKSPQDMVEGKAILDVPSVQSAITILAGPDLYQTIKGTLTVSEPIAQTKTYLHFFGCKANACAYENYGVLINKDSGDVSVCYFKSATSSKPKGTQTIYTTEGNIVNEKVKGENACSTPNATRALADRAMEKYAK